MQYIKEYADQINQNEYEESSEEDNAKARLTLFKTSSIHSKKVNEILQLRPLELLGLKSKIAEKNIIQNKI